jgi:hypothetical protein
MSNDKLRRQITSEAARLLLGQRETSFYQAKLAAARRIGQAWVKRADLPTDREIREEITVLTRLREGALQPSELPAAVSGNGHADDVDRYALYRALLAPLETVRQKPDQHPESDALYHSLQVFDLARNALPYDEEFQLAALLHDVGIAIDPRDHVAAGLEALRGHITARTAWLIEHHVEAAALREGTLGARARRRLEAAPDFDDLMLLWDCDRRGRQQGVQVPDIDEALAQLRELAEANGESA